MNSNILIKSFLIVFVSYLATSIAFADSSNVKRIYFGVYEVESGQLKSADGILPHIGDSVELQVNLQDLQSIACQNIYCIGMNPELYIRFNGNETFQLVKDMPIGRVNNRGPSVYWPSKNVDFILPPNADRIETFIKWNLHSWSAYGCHLAYDIVECDSVPIADKPYAEAYISNYGRNFSIAVLR